MNKKLLFLAKTFLMGILSFGTLTAMAASIKFGVVDVADLQNQFMSEVNAKLQSEFGAQQSDLQKKLDSFKTESEKFQKNVSTMSKSQVDKSSQELQAKQIALQKEVQSFDQIVAERKQKELQGKLKVLTDVVKKISDKEGYDVILAKNAALFVSEKFDVTEQVVSGYKKASSKS